MEKQPIYLFDHFQLDPAQKILLRDGQRVPLDLKTFLILLALVESAGQVTSKHELMARVWPDTFVEENNLTKNISRLRKSLGNGSESAEFIETVPKIGYRFLAEVTTAQSQIGFVKHTPAVTEQKDDGQLERMAKTKAEDDLKPAQVVKPVRRRWLWAGLAVLLAVGVALIGRKWLRSQSNTLPVADEFAPVRLTNHLALDWQPTYSPDGKKIVFASNRDGETAIYVINADGSNVRKLVNDLPDCSLPTWSSDGMKLYFYSESRAYMMNADGGNLAKIPDPFGKLSPDGKKTVFVSGAVPDSQASYEIYVANADGSNQIRLTNNHSLDADPAWSPDSKRIVFTCFPDGFVDGGQNNAEICVMSADGSDVIRLTNDPAWDSAPAWSWDGTRILFNSRRGCNGQDAIYVMNADGGNAMQLTDCGENARPGNWSPDGKRIVYESRRDGNSEIYSINADPSHQTNITQNPAEDIEPAWSHNGQQIAFISNRDGKNSLFVMDADGGNQRKLVSNIVSRPSWSPDDRRIVFTADWAGNQDIYIANADGSGIAQLTRTSAIEHLPTWSPNGAKILFAYDVNDTKQLFVMNADGSGVTRLSNSPEHEVPHDWSPDGKQIVFTRSRNQGVQRDIWLMNADGGNPHLLAFSPGTDEFLCPRFSPDGRRIAFHRRVASPLQADVWVMNADGSGQTRLTHLGGGVPAWSPDGKKIAFYSIRRTGNSEIYVMNVTGK